MKQNEVINSLVNDIVEFCKPVKVFLVSNKFNTKKELTSFKLCVIVNDVPSITELEGELYMKTDCLLPFDVLIYNLSEWESLIQDEDTFAARINRTGVVFYEQ